MTDGGSRFVSHAQLTFISLFCGAGGFDLGFVQAGFRCVAAYDISPVAVRVHRTNLGSSAEVCDLSLPSFLASRLSGVDVLIAGPPCQGFSTAGKRNIHDPRNNLLLIAGKIAESVRPKVFVAENVTGVTSGQHGIFWNSLKNGLSSAGYFIKDACYDTSKLGVPQVRKRMIMVARWGAPITALSMHSGGGGVLRDALANISGASGHDPHLIPKTSYLTAIAAHIKPGQKLCNVRGGRRSIHTWDIPEVFGYTTEDERRVLEIVLQLRRRSRLRNNGDADPVLCSAISAEFGLPAKNTLTSLIEKRYIRKQGQRYDLTHTFNGKFRRLRWDEPSPTVDTRFGDPHYFLHPDMDRGFTVREAARIQGFPDTFVFSGTERENYRLIGNAVPPPLARYIAEYVRDNILI